MAIIQTTNDSIIIKIPYVNPEKCQQFLDRKLQDLLVLVKKVLQYVKENKETSLLIVASISAGFCFPKIYIIGVVAGAISATVVCSIPILFEGSLYYPGKIAFFVAGIANLALAYISRISQLHAALAGGMFATLYAGVATGGVVTWRVLDAALRKIDERQRKERLQQQIAQ